MNRFIKTVLATALIPFAAQSYAANENTAVTPTEKAKIESVVHDYLLKNPEVVVEALQTMQRKQYEQAEQTMKQTQKDAQKYADALFHQANDPVAGNAKGKVTVVEFFDYQCPHCVDMAPVIESAIKSNADLRIVYKEFPIRGPMSDFAARAALAANKQGKYYALHHAMLTANARLTEDSIYKMAADAGLNVEKLKTDMQDKSTEEQIKANMKLAQDLKLFGTPAFFIAKSDVTKDKGTVVYIPGQMNLEQMQTEISKISK